MDWFEAAPEWSYNPFSSYAEIAQRPENEVLFIRNAQHLFQPHKFDDPRHASRRSAAIAAVNLAFWLTMERLSNVFEIEYRTYLVGLTESAHSYAEAAVPYLGLEIVDAQTEARNAIKAALQDFKESSGYSPEEFHAACNVETGYRRFENASRRLRDQREGREKLTPKTVERLYEFLELAERYGIWRR